MTNPEIIYEALRECGVDFFTGVPDSLLKEFCSCVTDLSNSRDHVIAANEGGSVAIATGHYLATGKCPCVYLQNSGIGNTVNPVLSLTDPKVYAIPMLLIIGWRGEPGVKDEPQHVSQGEVTLPMLDVLGVPYYILPDDDATAVNCIAEAHTRALAELRPVAIVVQKGVFGPYQRKNKHTSECGSMTREQALEIILGSAGDEDAIVSTTGKTSREVFELREKYAPEKHQQDFLTVGSMGHCSQIALGIALAQPERRVICLDGDGAALMHMGGMAIIGQCEHADILHVVLNNGAHESVGGQPTVAGGMDFMKLGEALGYQRTMSCSDVDSLSGSLAMLDDCVGPVLLEVKVALGSRGDLGRPTLTPSENKKALMNFLRSQE